MSIIKPSDLLKSALLESMDDIDFFSNEYKEENWKKIVSDVPSTELKVEGIPQDIVNVLVFKIGFEDEAKEWLQTPFPNFNNKTALELLKTEKGTKALKQFILRIPM